MIDAWEQFPREVKADLLRTTIDSIYVKKGHSQKGEPIEDRVLIRWEGEDVLDRPQRGTTNYRSRPVPWPPDGVLPLANIPEWAVRLGHPHLPEDLRQQIQEQARKDDTWWYLLEDEGGRARTVSVRKRKP